jgi:hypothetical protein
MGFGSVLNRGSCRLDCDVERRALGLNSTHMSCSVNRLKDEMGLLDCKDLSSAVQIFVCLLGRISYTI